VPVARSPISQRFSQAALDLHIPILATSLGEGDPAATGPITLAEGEKVSALIRKGR
jgi:hypothetical protein